MYKDVAEKINTTLSQTVKITVNKAYFKKILSVYRIRPPDFPRNFKTLHKD
jgi:hypothetical protein